MWDRSGGDGGVYARVMGGRCCNNRRWAMACGLSQSCHVGLGLKVVGIMERVPSFMVVGAPIDVVVTPVKGRSIHSTIRLKQLLFNKIAAIYLCIAKLVTGKAGKMGIRESAEEFGEGFLSEEDETFGIIYFRGRE